jgi:hypothetical protein
VPNAVWLRMNIGSRGDFGIAMREGLDNAITDLQVGILEHDCGSFGGDSHLICPAGHDTGYCMSFRRTFSWPVFRRARRRVDPVDVRMAGLLAARPKLPAPGWTPGWASVARRGHYASGPTGSSGSGCCLASVRHRRRACLHSLTVKSSSLAPRWVIDHSGP